MMMILRLVLFGPIFLVHVITANPLQNEFDFVVVGGGTAGCVVASRLSENGKHAVLLIHDGGEPHPDLEVPGLSRQWVTPENTKVYNLPQNSNAGNRVLRYLVGRPLGGSSSINGMMYNRGSPLDFDNWARTTGDASWKYANMLKYFKKAEDYRGEFPSDQHGYNGPITISRPRYAPQLKEWMGAGRDLGYPIADPNGPQKVSYTPAEFSKKSGRRVNSYMGYIKPYLGKRSNLKIATHSEATRIIFRGKKAIGVESIEKVNGTVMQSTYITARKEVIVCGGVFGSPVLLMKSGIGPKSDLLAVNIQPLVDLPVGKNLHDHIGVHLVFVINNNSLLYNPQRDLTPANFLLYNQTGEGPYSSVDGVHAQAFLATSIAKREGQGNWADIQIKHSPVSINVFNQFTNGITLAEWERFVYFGASLGRPKSRGWLKLNSSNVNDEPELNFQYISNPQDEEKLIEGIKFGLKMYEETPTFRSLGAYYLPVPMKACQHLPFRTDEYWRCYVKNEYSTNWHAGGTCKMGAGSRDKSAVVDSNLKVIGIESLRVVDTSIMPQITNANTQAPVYGIAEKASDTILEEWERRPSLDVKKSKESHSYSYFRRF